MKTDQHFECNSRSCGALVQYEDGKVTRTKPFPLSYCLHFKSTVATIAIAVDYGVQLDKDIEIYTVHYHAIDKALRPAKTPYYDIAERCFHRLGAWNHQLDCYWVPSHKLPKQFAAVKKKIAAHRKDVEPHKTIPAMKSRIRRLFKTEWAEAQEKLGRGSMWMDLKLGALPLPKINKWIGKALGKTFPSAARLVRVLTGHAPTGEYRKRIFKQTVIDCNACNTYHTREHILHACRRYASLPYSFIHEPNSFSELTKFLKSHTSAFSFCDAPYEPP